MRWRGALTVGELKGASGYPVAEEFLRPVLGASVLYADRTAIEADFPELAGETDRTVDDWLLTNGALLAAANCQDSEVAAAPPSGAEERLAFRPPRYGRAGLVPVAPYDATSAAKLVDVKGIGLARGRTPSLQRQGSGLALLPDAFRELINGAVLSRLFRREKSGLAVLPCYGLVNLGFRARHAHFPQGVPAVTLLRGAAIRWAGNVEIGASGSPEEAVQLAIETFLRRVGITSAAPSGRLNFSIEGERLCVALGPDRYNGIAQEYLWELVRRTGIEVPCAIDITNVQVARNFTVAPLSAILTDLEQYRNVNTTGALGWLTFVSDQPFNWGQLVTPGDPGWVVADPIRGVDPDLFGPGPFTSLSCDVLHLDTEARMARDIEGSIRHAYHLAAQVMSGTLDRHGLAARLKALAHAIVPD